MKVPDTQLESSALAPYAMHSSNSTGRQHPEDAHPYRGPFQRDRDRVVHSSAYRRLAHKTQVFTGDMGDYHRSRLTHTLEVASIARTVGRALCLNEDLIEAMALMHDIGHPPFGHAGEDVLNDCTQSCGGFNHNAHALRIVTLLESRYPGFPGLNLTNEVLSGQATRSNKSAPSSEQPLLEVQVVDAADSIAYDTHDADDALELGLLDVKELLGVSLWYDAAKRVQDRYTSLSTEQLRRAAIHQLIETLVSDLIDTTRLRLTDAQVDSPADVAAHADFLVAPSAEFREKKTELEEFLFERVYRHPTVLAERSVAGAALREMFERFSATPQLLPGTATSQMAEKDVARSVCDFLAGMTDRHALEEYRNGVNY
ncbi:MAG: dNTP triphosphohydrolase [Pirellulales bacterium]|nr:dNTP triphosphohydrolase [Pirellulales bacterium]